MHTVTVTVTLKAGLLDAEGGAIKQALGALGFGEVHAVRVGKHIELDLGDGQATEGQVRDMCEKLLANPVVEDYKIEGCS